MSECHWNMLAIGDKKVCIEIHPGFACGTKDVQDGVPHLRMNNISTNGAPDFSLIRRIPKEIAEKRGRWLQLGDILFCNTNSTELVGKTCLFSGWDEQCTYSNHLTKLRCNTNSLLPKWLALCLQKLWFGKYFATNCKEFIGQSAFSNDKLKAVKIPVPPLDEQRRIVTRIEELTHRVEEALKLRREVVEKISTHFFHVRRKIFESLLSEWPTRPLGKCGKVIGGGTPSKQRADFWDGDIPWISAKDMKKFVLTDAGLKITEKGLAESSAKLIPEKSVLFVVRGSILYRYVPVSVNTMPCTINQDLKAIAPHKSIDSIFLTHMLWGANDQLQGMVEEAGNTAGKLPTPSWASFEVPIPDKATQQTVIGELQTFQDKISELEKLQAETTRELEIFHSALVAKAFRGEI